MLTGRMIFFPVLAALVFSPLPASASSPCNNGGGQPPTRCSCASSLSVNVGVAEGNQCAYIFSLPEPEDGTCPTQQQAMCQWLAMQQLSGLEKESGLIAYYAFDDNLLDSTANHRDGTTPTGDVIYDTGVCGKAGVFDGASKVEVDGFRNYQWGRQFSVSVWFKRTSAANYQGIVNTGYHSTGSWEIRIGRTGQSGGQLGGGVVTADNAATWNYRDLVATVGGWHHAVMTYDGSELLFYLDNQLQSVGSTAYDCCHGDIISKDTPLTIGQAGVGTTRQFFMGAIDEVKIFGKALSAEEVGTLFTNPCAGSAGPVCPGT